jgi:hypothetical protein
MIPAYGYNDAIVFGFRVDNIEAGVVELEAAGCELLCEVRRVPGRARLRSQPADVAPGSRATTRRQGSFPSSRPAEARILRTCLVGSTGFALYDERDRVLGGAERGIASGSASDNGVGLPFAGYAFECV